MTLRDYFTPDAVDLELGAESRPDALSRLVGLLHVDDTTAGTLLSVLLHREQLGSTGVGRGIAIPHCRSPVVPQLRLAYGRIPGGLDYQSIDGRPVHHLFLIVAPPPDVSNLYLPVLGQLAQFAKAPDIPDRLMQLGSAGEFFDLLTERGA
jgi:mannitol/fructose-specific phosphotransferase system IIA component (Ntr-type)